LALALGGRTVAELKASMSLAEFERWAEFYRMHPFDDLHRYHRPAALIAHSFSGGDIEQMLDFLQPPYVPEDMTEADMNTLRAFRIKRGG